MMLRKVIPFIVALVAAFAITGLAELNEWPSGFVYGLIGFVGGALMFLGIPFAFDFFLFNRRHQVHPHKSAVVAKEGGYRVALAYDEIAAASHRLEQDEFGGLRPFIMATRGTVRVSPSVEEPAFERGKVGHHGLHLKPNSPG